MLVPQIPVILLSSSADPILPDGAINATWVFAIGVLIIGFFLHRFFNQMDELKNQMISIDKTQGLMAEQLKQLGEKIDKVDHDKIAELAMAKLLALQGGTGHRFWPFQAKSSEHQEE